MILEAKQQLKNYMCGIIDNLSEKELHKLKSNRPWMFKNSRNEFETKLRTLCIAYDEHQGLYPESELEGMALFNFFVMHWHEAVEPPVFKSEYLEKEWNEFDKRRIAGYLI